MHHHSALWKSQDSFAKKRWDPTLCHIQENTYQTDQHHWHLQTYTVQGRRTGGDKNLWLNWSSISTCISNARNRFPFTKVDSYIAVGTASQKFISLDWLSRTLLLHFPIFPQNSFLFKKHIKISFQITMHSVWSKGKCTVAVVSINVAPKYSWHSYQNGRATSKQSIQRVGPHVHLWILCREKKAEIENQSKSLSGGELWREYFDNSNSLLCLCFIC